ncbi:MAG: class II fructose-bisphosphate aldolase [Candidatus Taylorbacteria bacterium]|nr:class II fructose-bisphosphate aldolase [Candidatus Taylorbacteria bacterium]
MKTLRQYIKEAEEKGVAIGHFNISNLEILRGIFEASRKMGVPVIIGTAEGERKYIGTKQAASLVKSLREEYKAPDVSGEQYPIFLNADHIYSVDGVKECIDAGYDSVIFDGTKLSHEENIKLTKECVDYARNCGRDVIVEAELGFIGSSSKVLDKIPDGVKITEEFLTKPEEAKKFVEETGVDMLAPAVGNIHGMLKGGVDPALNIKRIDEIKKAVGIPLVLHGASGNSRDDIKDAIKSGMSIVHVNTEIRVAFKKALESELLEKKDEVAPYKYMEKTITTVQQIVEEKLAIFNER